MVLAHMGHPWFDDCIAVVRKQPNVFCEVSAIFYRPWQYYNILISAQEYKIVDKIFFGTDFPFSRVGESVEGLLRINEQVDGTKLPRVGRETMDMILRSDPFAKWWKGDSPIG
jgi:predicted TIM-barrel fold metal-dependent hydrolase